MPNHHPPQAHSHRITRRRRRLRAGLAGAAAAFVVGCAASPDIGQPADSARPDRTARGPAAATTAELIADRLADADPTHPLPPAPPDHRHLDQDAVHDPERAAAALILDGLGAQGLLVTSLDTDLLNAEPQQATVAVTVAHSPGHGHPTQSRYDLELARHPHGWELTGYHEHR